MTTIELILLEEQNAAAADASLSGSSASANTTAQAVSAATAANLAAAAKAVGSSAPDASNGPTNIYSTPGDNNFTWPWDPNSGIPNIGNNINASLASLTQAWEQACSYLQNNADSYNGFIQLVPMLIAMGNDYPSLSPSQQAQFNSIITDMGSYPQLSTILMQSVMEGAFYQSAQTGSGYDFTNVNNLMNYVVGQFSGLSGISPFFADLANAATQERNTVLFMETNNVITWTDGSQTTYTLSDKHGAPMDFAQFLDQQMSQIGSILQSPDLTNSINSYYSVECASIIQKFKGDPWAMFIEIMALLLGLDDDMSRVVNGEAGTLNDLKNCVNIANQILPLMKSGQFVAGDTNGNAKKLMGLLQQLQAAVDSNPKLASVASLVDASINQIMGTQITPTNQAYTVGEGIYNVPQGCTIQYTSKDGGAATTYTGPKSFYVGPAGGVIVITSAPSGCTLADIAANATMIPDSTNPSNTLSVNSLGDYGDAANYFASMQGSDQDNSLVNQITSIESTLTSPNSSIQNDMSNETSLKSTFEAFFKSGMGSDGVIGGVEANITKNMQSANS